MLKNKADLRTVLWMVSSTSLFFYLWNSDGFVWWLYAIYLYFAVCFSIFAHNHNHVPIWKYNILNHIHSYWITIFYGLPSFVWIPTHNRNHHRYNNTEEDLGKTYIASEKNNIWTFLTYPFLSGAAQQKAIYKFYLEQFRLNKSSFYFYTSQFVFLILWVLVAVIFDWQKAIIYVILPQQVSLYVVVLFNYIQHIHADEESKFNHSRNIIGWSLNFFLFNNGLHTIHHQKPNLHWSDLREAHNKIEHRIDPVLNEEYLFWYLFRVYILGLFMPRFKTTSMRLERMRRQDMNS